MDILDMILGAEMANECTDRQAQGGGLPRMVFTTIIKMGESTTLNDEESAFLDRICEEKTPFIGELTMQTIAIGAEPNYIPIFLLFVGGMFDAMIIGSMSLDTQTVVSFVLSRENTGWVCYNTFTLE